jgi:hypothetical protein
VDPSMFVNHGNEFILDRANLLKRKRKVFIGKTKRSFFTKVWKYLLNIGYLVNTAFKI